VEAARNEEDLSPVQIESNEDHRYRAKRQGSRRPRSETVYRFQKTSSIS
jgi:hypothetical protein